MACKHSIAEINAAARALHMSYGNFVAAGLPVPDNIALQNPPAQRSGLIDADLFEDLYSLGYTDTMISQQMCVRYATVAAYRRKRGLPPNRKYRERSRNYGK